MPTPRAGEAKKDYISRFMKSGEAQSDFPDEKQRLAVAYSMFEKKNSVPSYGRQYPWPKQYTCSFIEPGVVFYQDLGLCKVCGDKRSCGEGLCDTEGETVLVKQECLDKMAKSFVGKPVIDQVHKDVNPSTVADGEADGIVTRVWFDPKTSWWMCEFLVWDMETQQHCESVAYSVSCAYEPTAVNDDGGEYHNLSYHEEILDGEYTHLAIVTNPRYEGARIFVNSKGGKMSWKFWEKGARKNAAPIDPSKEMVNVDGAEVSLGDLYASLEEEKPKYNDDTVLETPKGEKTLGELKQAYRNKLKNAEPKPCATCNGSGKEPAKKENAEPGHAEHRESEKVIKAEVPPVKTNSDEVVQEHEQAKKLPAEMKEKRPLELTQADGVGTEGSAEKSAEDLDKKPEGKRPLELDQARDADAGVAGKPTGIDDKAEEHAEKKNAKEAKELANGKKEAGKKSFEALRNARFDGEAGVIQPVALEDRLARGRDKYGSA